MRAVRPVHRAVLLSLDGVTDRDAAQALAHSVLEVAADELPAPAGGEVYVYELVGATVCDEAGARLGEIRRVVSAGGQELLEIRTPKGDELLPLAPSFIVAFDRARRTLTVRVAPGLWET